jgi:aspartate/methionine/tyrosine aminotransferase
MTLSRTATTFFPPVMEARRWLDGVDFPPDRPLINVSQAAPVDPPPAGLRQAMADVTLHNDEAHLYGPVLGLPELRAELARQTAEKYAGVVTDEQVCITSGCNQAFAAAIATLCGEGDEVIIPTPWYFNHKMWLDMSGVAAVPLPVEADMLPDPEKASAAITLRTRAIALVTPNNPGGVEYPAALVQEFFELARRHGIALILDETYRDFHSRPGAPHALFRDPDWHNTLIHLYSFSKAYRLTGHRVGAVTASPARIAQMERFLDTVTICPTSLGQKAALWGMRNLGDWLSGERAEIIARRRAMEASFARLEGHGWKLMGCGAYFGWIEHPFEEASDALAQRLVHEAGVLLLPGTMFTPEGSQAGRRQLRIAFANVDAGGINELETRLAALPAR